MNRKQMKLCLEYMESHMTGMTTATELAEITAYEMGLEDELDDETSPIWQLAQQFFTEAK